MTQKLIDPFDDFFCASNYSPEMAFSVCEIYKSYGDKTCIRRKSIHKFGENSQAGNIESPLNSWGEFEEYQTSNVILNLSSTDAADTATVTIEYMSFDVNGEFVFGVQSKQLNGQAPVQLNDTGCRWMRMYTDNDHAGSIYLYRGTATNGTPDDLASVHNQIVAGRSQSQKTSTSVDKDSYFLLTHVWADVIRKAAVSASINFKTRELGKSFRIRPRRGFSDSRSLEYNILPHLIIEPNTDIEVTVQTDSNSPTDVTAGFNGYFADIISAD